MNQQDPQGTGQEPPGPPHAGPARRGLPRSVAFLAAAVVALAIASILFSINGDGGVETGTLVDDDFSEAGDHWNLDSYKGIATSIEDGAYRVSLSRADSGWLDSVTFEDATEYPAVLVESQLQFDQTADGANVGLACVSNTGDGESMGLFGRYEATIDLDGHAIVERFINGDTVTVEEVQSPVELSETETNDLALKCRFENEIASVALSLNGKEVIAVENETSLVGYEGAGMVANSMGAGLEVSFDHLTATAID